MFKSSLLLLSIFQLLCLQAQPNSTPHSAHIVHQLQSLNTVGNVLYIAAHPDDENTRLLSYLANDRHYRTAYLSLTRGDGGQNLIGNQKGTSLGIIRTQELIAARKTDGAEQYFTRAYDFGYSKSPKETLQFWNKDSLLKDMVWIIRQFKPDVIICRFPTTGEGGHGHHTASALLAMEAFDLAANPEAYKEQLKTTQTWKCKRMYWNTFNFGTINTTNPNQLKIDVGGYNPLLGKSYGEIAADSRTMHKSQGFGSAKQRGQSLEYFKLMKGDSAQIELFDNIETSYKRFENGAAVQKAISQLIQTFNYNEPANNIPALLKIRKLLHALNTPQNKHWVSLKLNQLDGIIKACLGLYIETSTTVNTTSPSQKIALNTQVIHRNQAKVNLISVTYPDGMDTAIDKKLNHNEMVQLKRTFIVPKSFPYTNPYWLSAAPQNNVFNIQKDSLLLLAENKPPFMVSVLLTVDGEKFTYSVPVLYKNTDPTKGEELKPIEVLPEIVFMPFNSKIVINNINEKLFKLTIKAIKDQVSGKLHFKPNDYVKIEILNPEFKNLKKGEEYTFDVFVKAQQKHDCSLLEPYISSESNTFQHILNRIEYDHIPPQLLLEKAEIKLCFLSVKTAQLNIAYVEGSGDDVTESLKQLGYNITFLTPEQLNETNLSSFSAIVFGVRALNIHPSINLAKDKLNLYIKNGGNVLVQYNTNSRVGPVQNNIGPYPFDISRNRVTDENSPVRFLQNQHPAFNEPNPITEKDFDAWVQERGIYFAQQYDKNYTDLLAMNDPDEAELLGSLIVGQYGKGHFIYTGLAFFRQLPEGNEGAMKLFVNLLSLKNNDNSAE